ncbi:DUF3999 domain-containing protein [Granulicella cerasi]|uniref:DUF3999 domain-containing protein n=1 Tax=Granulicella cerasi TaxID=741063 RepID=A0ABW1ZB66_9BACT|nr:DUF3999 domain-containing protein [Granulicella cerasi]
MKSAIILLSAFLFQATEFDAPSAEPQHLRFERAVNVSAPHAETSCIVLDAELLAHGRDRAGSDLRLYRDGNIETPYALTESSASTRDADTATVQNLGTTDHGVSFDLMMPARPYSAVDLQLDAKDFVATAEVSGLGVVPGSAPVKLGVFTLFDLSSQHLGRATTLPLAEETFPRLHIVLRFTALDGTPRTLPASTVQSATVPPSREAQTLYTAVASASSFQQDGHDSVARLQVPAHVPLERLRVLLPPSFHGNFLRNVSLRDVTQHSDGAHGDELNGEISRVDLPAPYAGAAPIHSEHLTVDAVMAANLREPATIELRIANGNDQPLPLSGAVLEMRERRLCFHAESEAHYKLMYGDNSLTAPVYDYARLFQANDAASSALLGPEQLNPAYKPREDHRPFTERHPELLWIALLAVVAILGATSISQMKHRSGHR